MMRRCILVASVALLLVATLAPAPASAVESFDFYGSGWGHRIGMSQYGALGLAQKGNTRDAILQAFYTNVTIGQAPSPPAKIRVGLYNTVSSIRLKAVDTGVALRLGSTAATPVATIPAGETWTIEILSAAYRIKRADGTYVGTSHGNATSKLYATYAGVGGGVYLPGTFHTYRRGYMEFNLHQTCLTCSWYLRLIIILAAEGYMMGLGEVPSSWPAAALQAQAVAGRSYAFAKVRDSGQNRSPCNCALYASTFDQVYVGSDKELGYLGENWAAAVNATTGLVALHGGSTITAFYSSSSGGLTESNADVWGGAPLPYLGMRCDAGDYTASNPNRIWTATRDGVAIGNGLLAATGTDIGNALGFSNMARAPGGHVKSLTVNGTKGSVTVSGATFRFATGITSARFWINTNRHITGRIRTTYDGKLCAPGLPTSASIKVTDGRYMRFAVGRIYANYLTGGAYWLEGPIHDKYLSMGAHNGLMGLPVSGTHQMGTTAGRKANFTGGRIYWIAATGAHESHDPVLAKYLTQGEGGGTLGFPTTDVVSTGPDTVQQTFQNGVTTCTVSTGVCTSRLN